MNAQTTNFWASSEPEQRIYGFFERNYIFLHKVGIKYSYSIGLVFIIGHGESTSNKYKDFPSIERGWTSKFSSVHEGVSRRGDRCSCIHYWTMNSFVTCQSFLFRTMSKGSASFFPPSKRSSSSVWSCSFRVKNAIRNFGRYMFSIHVEKVTYHVSFTLLVLFCWTFLF